MGNPENIGVPVARQTITTGLLTAGTLAALNVTFAPVKPIESAMAQGSFTAISEQQLLDARLKAITAETDAKVAKLAGQIEASSVAARAIEARLNDLAARLATVPQDLATLTERVAHLPSKSWLLKTGASIAGLIVTAILLQDKLRVFLHLT